MNHIEEKDWLSAFHLLRYGALAPFLSSCPVCPPPRFSGLHSTGRVLLKDSHSEPAFALSAGKSGATNSSTEVASGIGHPLCVWLFFTKT